MRGFLRYCGWWAFGAGLLWGQATPYVYYRGIYNASSYTPPGLPGSAIARGSIFTIFGRNLGPANPETARFPIGSSLGGVSLEICAGATCRAGLPLFVSAQQINAILPSNAPLGKVTLRVRVNGVNSNWTTMETVEASPGLFAVNAAGFGPGIVQNFNAAGEAPLNSLGNRAEPGQTLIAYGTGLGAIATPDSEPAGAGNVGTVEVLVGEQVVRPSYAGRAPGFAGLDQVNFVVPEGVGNGCYVPLRIRSGGRATSNTVTIAVGAKRGERCEDGHNPVSGPLSLGRRVAVVLPQRLENDVDIDPTAPYQFLQEWLVARIGQTAASDFLYSPLSLPPAGTCGAHAQAGNMLDSGLRMAGVSSPASALRLRVAAAQSQEVAAEAGGGFSHVTNLTYGLANAVRAFFTSPSVSLSGEGIEGQFPAPRALSLQNAAVLRNINRGQNLTVTWSGTSGSDQALVVLAAYDEANHASAMLACMARPGENSMRVPAALLATLPVTPKRLSRYGAVLGVGRLPVNAAALTAPGYDLAIAALGVWAMQNVWLEGGVQ